MNTTVIIATADRPQSLASVLRRLSGCERPDGELRVLVADNGTDEGTAVVCAAGYGGLSVEHLRIERRGKSSALNAAVERARSDLLVFTDDDVEFEPRWLVELRRAATVWPDHRIFGGRVLPLWPSGRPAHLEGSKYLGVLYAKLDRAETEGPVEGLRPFGPNMAVRASVFRDGIRFDESIGPGSVAGVSMGDETDIAVQLASRGEAAVWVPSSKVYHRVREEQLSLKWQLERGVRYGRAVAYLQGPAPGRRFLGVPLWVLREMAAGISTAGWNVLWRRRRRAFDRLMDLAVALGRASATKFRDRELEVQRT